MQPLSPFLSPVQSSVAGIISPPIQGVYNQKPSAVFEESLSLAVSTQDVDSLKSLTENSFFQEMPLQKFFEVLYGCVSLLNVKVKQQLFCKFPNFHLHFYNFWPMKI